MAAPNDSIDLVSSDEEFEENSGGSMGVGVRAEESSGLDALVSRSERAGRSRAFGPELSSAAFPVASGVWSTEPVSTSATSTSARLGQKRFHEEFEDGVEDDDAMDEHAASSNKKRTRSEQCTAPGVLAMPIANAKC